MTYTSYGWGYCECPPTRVFCSVPGMENLQEGTLLGFFATPGKMLSCRVLLDNGAMLSKLPLDLLALTAPAFYPLQIWDCPSYGMSITEISHLKSAKVLVKGKNFNIDCTYLFTITYWGGDYTDLGGTLGYKDAHILLTPSGRLIAYPNSHICWKEKSTVEPFDWNDPPKIDLLPEVTSCENQ